MFARLWKRLSVIIKFYSSQHGTVYLPAGGLFYQTCQNQNESIKMDQLKCLFWVSQKNLLVCLGLGFWKEKCFLSMHSEWKSVSTESNPWQWRCKYREANNRRRTLSSLTRLNVFSSEGGRFQKESLQDSLQHLWHPPQSSSSPAFVSMEPDLKFVGTVGTGGPVKFWGNNANSNSNFYGRK